jgi:hypothetical protein
MKTTRVSPLDGDTMSVSGYKLFWGRSTAELVRSASRGVSRLPQGLKIVWVKRAVAGSRTAAESAS